MSCSKVYLITTGEYSSYRVCGAFSSKEKALNFIGQAEDGKDGHYYPWECPFNLEIYDLDVGTDEIKYLPFVIEMDLSGNVINSHILDYRANWPDRLNYDNETKIFEFFVFAKDLNHAIKICGERRIRWKLEMDDASKR